MVFSSTKYLYKGFMERLNMLIMDGWWWWSLFFYNKFITTESIIFFCFCFKRQELNINVKKIEERNYFVFYFSLVFGKSCTLMLCQSQRHKQCAMQKYFYIWSLTPKVKKRGGKMTIQGKSKTEMLLMSVEIII